MRDVSGATPEEGRQLVEVWGDVVDERGVRVAVLFAVVVAVPAFLLAEAGFSAAVSNQDLSRTYAMVVGIVACLGVGAVVAKLYKPQRVITELGADAAGEQRRILRELSEAGGLGSLESLSPRERAELRRQGLEELFLEAEQECAGGAAGAAGADDAVEDKRTGRAPARSGG